MYGAEYVLPLVLGRVKVALPPIAVRSHDTTSPVLGGLDPPNAVALSVVCAPTTTLGGSADPCPEGLLSSRPRIEMSSTASACAFVTVLPAVTE